MRNIIFVLLICMLSNYGCSVGMAMSGKDNPNLGMVRSGASRGEVELTLGPPVSTVTIEDGRRIDVYEYEIGNEPSAGRAIGHGIMDILTFGLWEIIGTPIEGVQGNKYRMQITYDRNDRVIAINQSAPPATAKAIEVCDPSVDSCT
ncbi:MAG: hypothetical protein IH886_10325 [Nitrospinae bacterium]|nr:hypothetical protein [Nitrospinota bacterium]